MPPRLQHCKSRRGCRRCKDRKVKCDETRPSCKACNRHNLECLYDNFQQVVIGVRPSAKKPHPPPKKPRIRQSRSSPADQQSSANDAPKYLHNDCEDFDLDPETRHKLELKLLHYFCYVVSPTFMSAASPQSRYIWPCECVSVAFDNPCLLNAIFSIAALHAATGSQESAPIVSLDDKELADKVYSSFHRQQEPQRPDGGHERECYDYAEANRFYFTRAVQEQRRALDILSERNADAIFMTSVLLCLMMVPLEPKHQEDGEQDMYHPPIRWLTMGSGSRTVVMSSLLLLKPDSLISHIMNHSARDLREDINTLHPNFIVPYQPLLDFSSPDDGDQQDPEEMEIYRKTLTYAGGVCEAVIRGEPPRNVGLRIQAFSSIIPKEFVDYLDQRRPRALVIFAHLMVNAKYVEDFWWYRGAADRDVWGVKSILPQEWMWAMEWPMERLKVLTEEGKSKTPSSQA